MGLWLLCLWELLFVDVLLANTASLLVRLVETVDSWISLVFSTVSMCRNGSLVKMAFGLRGYVFVRVELILFAEVYELSGPRVNKIDFHVDSLVEIGST